jgi:hypothetical protein
VGKPRQGPRAPQPWDRKPLRYPTAEVLEGHSPTQRERGKQRGTRFGDWPRAILAWLAWLAWPILLTERL